MNKTPTTENSRPQNIKNRLQHEKSPYLLQHADNPVDWYPWGEEAFAQARILDRPIFLSIGYSTCHWCHVMAHESFEDPAIAEILNSHFISIKVDREERPDIDQIYMAATQAMTGGGGWPMSVFLLDNKKPFYTGTYFPPTARFNQPGFADVLQAIQKAWDTNRQSLAESADKITDFLHDNVRPRSTAELRETWLQRGMEMLAQSYDTTWAGFGEGNKFPRPVALTFLLRYYHRTGDTNALHMAETTFAAMADGGMYDHIGGGFHRYSVDSQWRIPHFEKMLYDQAQLVSAYVELYQLTHTAKWRRVAEETIDYVLHEMCGPDGELYSAEDADSENPYDPEDHGEGAYFLWTAEEIEQLLDEDVAAIFIAAYGVLPNGNALSDPASEFTGRNILYRNMDTGSLADRFDRSEEEIHATLVAARQRLLSQRKTRKRPHVDDKVITAWNGLMLTALARAGTVFNRSEYVDAAARTADFLLTRLRKDGALYRRWRQGESRFTATLEDYSFLVQGLLDLYFATHSVRWLQEAESLTEKQLELFSAPQGGFFDSVDSTDLLTRMRESYDGAEPTGNSVAAMNLLRLSRLLNRDEWRELGQQTIASFGETLEQYPPALPLMLSAYDLLTAPPHQTVVTGNPTEEKTQQMLALINSHYLPNSQLLLADGGDNQRALSRYLPYLATLTAPAGEASVTLCENFTCRLPITEMEQLQTVLAQAAASAKENAAGKPIVDDIGS